jgi:protein-disulfide isomerase
MRECPPKTATDSSPRAAECAGDQGKYWEMHERLFKNQQTLGAKDHSGHAASVGLDVSRFELCLETGKLAAKVSADMASGTKLKVAGTPTFTLDTSMKRILLA